MRFIGNAILQLAHVRVAEDRLYGPTAAMPPSIIRRPQRGAGAVSPGYGGCGRALGRVLIKRGTDQIGSTSALG
jgi:hypothetical protein